MTARAFLTAALMLGSGAAAVKLPAPEVLREHGVCLHRQAFTPAECDRIVEQFSLLDAQRDVRVEESVSRTNFFDTENAGGGAYDWIYDRILRFARVEAGGAAVEWGFDLARDVRTPNDLASKGLVDFVLMHEFHAGDFFDWHVDTKPNDGTGRTVNINVMLSDATEYEGGGLSVGGHAVGAKKGDLYWYPAAFPHKVGDIHQGLRHTLVVAIKAPPGAREATDYWQRAEHNFESLGARSVQGGRDAMVSKWHYLHGEFLVAGGREKEADMSFALAYAATPQRAQYATKFDEDGQRLVAAGRLAESLQFFKMAAMIDSENPLFHAHIESIEAALRPKMDTSKFPKKPPKSLF